MYLFRRTTESSALTAWDFWGAAVDFARLSEVARFDIPTIPATFSHPFLLGLRLVAVVGGWKCGHGCDACKT